ncbi:MAG TPA: alpha/beta fold hydrolase [Steroidobacteraceae bacterium]
MSTMAVYVHGLWLTGLEGGILRKRLAKDLNAETRAFSYASVRSGVSVNAQALGRFLRDLRADTLHLVGHSLGGLVILRLFESGEGDQLPPGRIVLLGSPLNGSLAARNLARLPFGKHILGRSVHEELLTPRERRWNGQRELGLIAGSLSMGLGRLVGTHGAPSDGTVFVDETRLAGVSQHLVLKVSHTGLPFSSGVARQTGAFLRCGTFIR